MSDYDRYTDAQGNWQHSRRSLIAVKHLLAALGTFAALLVFALLAPVLTGLPLLLTIGAGMLIVAVTGLTLFSWSCDVRKEAAFELWLKPAAPLKDLPPLKPHSS